MHASKVLSAAAAMTLAMAIAAEAQHRGDVARGAEIARDVCADCHSVEAAPQVLSTDAPRPFAMVAEDPAWDDAALRAYIRDPHPQMPQFEINTDRLDDVVAYIRSLEE